MILVTTLVQRTAYDLTPSDYRLKPGLWNGFVILNKIHAIWRLFRRYKVYTDPNNLSHLLAGHTLNFLAGDKVILRIAAQCLLISARLLECIERQRDLWESGRLWKEAVLGGYSMPIRIYWKDPSFLSRCKIQAQKAYNRIKRITFCTLSVFEHGFKLSMAVLDTTDAFSLSPFSTFEGLNESFVNAMKWIDTLVDNEQSLLNSWVENRVFLEKILDRSPLTYEQLLSGITKTLEKTEKVHTQTKKITSYANGIIITAGKRTMDEIMVSLGLPRFRFYR